MLSCLAPVVDTPAALSSARCTVCDRDPATRSLEGCFRALRRLRRPVPCTVTRTTSLRAPSHPSGHAHPLPTDLGIRYHGGGRGTYNLCPVLPFFCPFLALTFMMAYDILSLRLEPARSHQPARRGRIT